MIVSPGKLQLCRCVTERNDTARSEARTVTCKFLFRKRPAQFPNFLSDTIILRDV